VEQFEQIRRDRDREGLSIRALAERHGVHRRAVRQALLSPLPPGKRAPVGRPAPKLGPFRAVIDSWLEADREAPRKQRHTARRIHQRLVDEHGADVAEVTVRQYVQVAGERPWRLDMAGEDTERRALLIEEDGLDLALVSLSSVLGIERLPIDEAAGLLSAYDAGVESLPDRFGAWGSVALSEPFPWAVDDLLDRGYVGICLPAGALATPEGLWRCGHVLERLERRGAPLFVHPGPSPWEPVPEAVAGAPTWWPAMTRYVAEMAAAWHAFATAGRAEHPTLRVVFAMLAGGAPLHAERLLARGAGSVAFADAGVFYDTSSYGPALIAAMANRVGLEQLVYGSDRPVVVPDPRAQTSFADQAADALLVRNPARVLQAAVGVAA